MYEDAKLYSESSGDHQREAKSFLDQFLGELRWGPNENVLDIGCGPGDVTHNVLLPLLPNDFSNLVGVDISSDMVKYAQETWSHPRLTFRLLDIAEPDPARLRAAFEPLAIAGGFDKIFTFFCLQLVQNRRQMAENIRQLLRPGGQALLLLAAKSGAYIVWDTIVQSEKWNKYLKEVKLPVNPYQYEDDPVTLLTQTLEDAGLKVERCALQRHKNAFTTKTEDDYEKINRLRSVDPVIRLIPRHLRDDYMKDILDLTKQKVSHAGATDYNSVVIILSRPV